MPSTPEKARAYRAKRKAEGNPVPRGTDLHPIKQRAYRAARKAAGRPLPRGGKRRSAPVDIPDFDPLTHVCAPRANMGLLSVRAWGDDPLAFVSQKLKVKRLDPFRKTGLQLMLRALLLDDRVMQFADQCEECQPRRLQCANCDEPLTSPSVFCGEGCRQQGKLIRYARSTFCNGRFRELDIQEAIGVRLTMIFLGGYPERARELSSARRAEVFARDGSICRLCGSPGTEIDHIAGSSDNLANLRVVCGQCNKHLAEKALVTVTPESNPALFEQIERVVEAIAMRIAAPVPLRLCDDEISWNGSWQKLRARIRVHWRDRPQ